MTAITPETGLRARVRRLAAFVVAAGVCALGVGEPAMAADEPPAADEQRVDLHVTAGLRGTVAPGTSTSAVVTIDNETASELSAGRVEVELGTTPLSDDAAVTDWLEEGRAAGSFLPLGDETTKTAEAGGSATTTVFVPQETLTPLAPGVYPLRAALSDARTKDTSGGRTTTWDASATTVLVVTSTPTSPIGVLVPITATPAGGALLSAEELTELTAPDGDLTAQLDGVAGTTAVLALDPAIPAAIRALGTAAPSTATEWLERLDKLPNVRFALQFGDADLTVQAQAGLPDALTPLPLTSLLDPAAFPQQRAVTPTTTPGAPTTPSPSSSDEPALPTDQELQEISGALPGIVWPDTDLTQSDLAAFSGYLDGSATTVVSSEAVGGRSAAHASSGGQDLLVTDAATSAALSAAAAEPASTPRQGLLAEAAARLFLAGARAPGAPLLVGLERDENRSAEALRDAISAADSIGFEFSAVRAAPAVPVAVAETAAATRAPDLANLLSDEGSLTAFATILSDPLVLLSPERIRILRTIAVGSSDAAFAEKVADHRARTTETLGAVSIPDSSTIQLLTANADLPIAVRNDLPWPVSVRLFASPSDPRLEVEPVIDVQVQASSTTRAKVPVSARVGSGELDLRLALTSPTGVPIQSQQTVRVAVRAEWETIGLVIFGGLAVLLIALGVVRTVRRKRREAIEEQAVEAAVEELIEEKEAEAAVQEHHDGPDAPPTKESSE
ncbi:DUF6049 family protein [Microbacterium sp. CH1]|uniref:DUF6049 family protein n=1 Tax=Microbacterium sp. CH1 TaxID=1770208 RepID=UPI0007889C72|nr:DUF6049 family protein [Microbacterium sp. CH1]KYJ96902.1 hypothetical protein AUV07_03895 [Microbacterium sp. CH1]